MTIDPSELTNAGSPPERQKGTKAAKDFEALLISQMLQPMREEGPSWLGTGDDKASDPAFGLGEQELARALTEGGGLGLSKLIASSLNGDLWLRAASLRHVAGVPVPGGRLAGGCLLCDLIPSFRKGCQQAQYFRQRCLSSLSDPLILADVTIQLKRVSLKS